MAHITFQSPRSGKFVSDIDIDRPLIGVYSEAFQSPRSGKFVSDKDEKTYYIKVPSSVSIP